MLKLLLISVIAGFLLGVGAHLAFLMIRAQYEGMMG